MQRILSQDLTPHIFLTLKILSRLYIIRANNPNGEERRRRKMKGNPTQTSDMFQ
jgi:hypothetical protein